MHANLAAYLDWLRGWDVPFTTAAPVPQDPDFIGPLVHDPASPHRFELGSTLEAVVEHRDVAAGFAADHATASAARTMANPAVWMNAQRVWEIGCGTGVLCAVASRLGAKEVIGSDLCAEAIDLALKTTEGCAANVSFRQGHLLEPFEFDLQPPDLIVANLPHKPTCETDPLPVGQDGGAGGVEIHTAHAHQAAARLASGARIVLFLHSLPHPRLLGAYAEHFDLHLERWKHRVYGQDEYGSRHAVFAARAAAGTSLLVEHDGASAAVAGLWVATKR